jgi:hypothetical protein
MDPVTIEAGITLAEQIISALIKAAPAIEAGVVNTEPYIKALGQMLVGGNATQAQVDAMRAQLDADSADFQTPLPPDTL